MQLFDAAGEAKYINLQRCGGGHTWVRMDSNRLSSAALRLPARPVLGWLQRVITALVLGCILSMVDSWNKREHGEWIDPPPNCFPTALHQSHRDIVTVGEVGRTMGDGAERGRRGGKER